MEGSEIHHMDGGCETQRSTLNWGLVTCLECLKNRPLSVGVTFSASDECPSPACRVAQAFHETYERLAPEFGYETRRDSEVPWEDVPQNNKLLMVSVVQSLLDTGALVPVEQWGGQCIHPRAYCDVCRAEVRGLLA